MSSLETGACLCRICGWQLFWDGSDENMAILPGSFDEYIGTILVGHIFCADKEDYYQFNDSLPQAEADNPALTTQFYTRAVVQ